MNITRDLNDTPINWGALTELPACLMRYEAFVETASIRLVRFPDTVEHDSLEAAREDVLRNGPPRFYTIRISAKKGKQNTNLELRNWVSRDGSRYLELRVDRVEDSRILEAVCHFFGLEPAEPITSSPPPARTAFIAHHFDVVGTTAADKVARFLELLGFQVTTGRGYMPGPVSDKVRTRLEGQALVFAVLTPGDDATWLTQESILAHVNGKSLFLLKEQTTSFKTALLADHEYIPFAGSNIEATFIPILEGLGELGYFSRKKG